MLLALKKYIKTGLKYDRASGTIKNKINELEKGSAVENPSEKLKQLGSLPPIEAGQVLAGNVEQFPSLKRLPRSAPGIFQRTACVLTFPITHRREY